MTQLLLQTHPGWGRTGWCTHGRHSRCVSGPPGIAIDHLTTYICPCTCHESEDSS